MLLSEAERLSGVLHDARLVGADWDSNLGRVRLTLACLRRAEDGSNLAELPVDLDLTGCRAIAIGHNPGEVHIKPSHYCLERWIRGSDLTDWTFRPERVHLALNSPQAEEDVLCAYRLEWALGNSATYSTCDTRLVLFLENSGILGFPGNEILLALGGNAWSASSSGRPLDMETWESQFAAWWKNWDNHWHDSDEESDEEEPVFEDAFIPAGEDSPADLAYRPPGEPAVELMDSDVPVELMQPIRAWFEATHTCDWKRKVAAQRNLDLSEEDQVRREKDDYVHFFGRWGYARQIDEWWIERAVGEVSVRGVEHSMPDEEDPATNIESVWTFGLRLREGGWVIRTYSQGWPPFGSASIKELSEKPWFSNWSAGPIVSERSEGSGKTQE